MKILFIGGTGTISSACSELAVAQGHDLILLNRGASTLRQPVAGATVLHADIRDLAAVRTVLGQQHFDVVVNFVAFSPDQIETDLDLFRGRTNQYVFISSASAYQTPPVHLPVTESTPLKNPFWEYSRQKIACEARLLRAYRDEDFPVTIVRPSHTYDQTRLPMFGRWTVIERMRQGKPVVVHGDGTSLWTLTHNRDFAKGFNGLLGNSRAIGEAVHITSDEAISWNHIFTLLAEAAGVSGAPELVHIPSTLIAAYDRDWGDSLLGDKTHSMVFDNSKLKTLVPGFAASIPFSQGAREMIAWRDADPARRLIDADADRLIDALIAAYERALPMQ